MAGSIWRGQKADIKIEEDSTELTVGILQEVEVSPSKEISELYGAGSIKRQDVQQTEFSVTVSGTLAAWDMATFESLVDYDSSNDEINDTSDVPTFTVTANVTDNSGTEYNLEVNDAYSEDVPISGSRDEWIELDMEFIGSDLSITEVV